VGQRTGHARCAAGAEACVIDTIELGRRIRSLREARGWSLNQMATRIRSGFQAGSYLSRLERGEKTLSLRYCESIADVTGASLHELLEGIDKLGRVPAAFEPDPFFEEISRLVHSISPAQRAVVIEVLRDLHANARRR
jgi:transcriptional regulator with XRE-family HTH domain